MKKLYLASPLGFSEAGNTYMYFELMPMIKKLGFEILDPWKINWPIAGPITKMPWGEERRAKWAEANPKIGKNNEDAIRECDFLLAILDGVDVDSGTASEIGFAAALGKKIIGYRGDFRLSSENEAGNVNIQVEYFIKRNNGVLVRSMDELKKALEKV